MKKRNRRLPSVTQLKMGPIFRLLSQRREQLGMSDYHIAQRSGVSQPTVHRILSGQNPQASFENVMAIALSMGITLEAKSVTSVGELRESRAKWKAEKIANMTQATSALEGQGFDPFARLNIVARIKQKLLAGPAKDLWSE